MADLKIWQYKLPSIRGEGWALIILREDGFFSAVSDYGNYAFLWTHHGHDDFRKFFLRVDAHYICNKLSPGQRLYPDESFKRVRRYITEERRAGSWDKQKAREMIEHVKWYESDEDWEGFLRDAQTHDYFSEPWEFGVYEHPADVRAFSEIIVCKRLRALIEFEMNCEKDECNASVQSAG